MPGAAALVDAAVAQERALQNARNERVLQMLKSKVSRPLNARTCVAAVYLPLSSCLFSAFPAHFVGALPAQLSILTLPQ